MTNGKEDHTIRVFKFGGGSVSDAESVRNVAKVLEHHMDQDLLLVFSAMGKTTNELERVLGQWKEGGAYQEIINEVRNAHEAVMEGLFHDREAEVYGKVEKLFGELDTILAASPDEFSYDEAYDRVVPFGELLSTSIISEFLALVGHPNRYFDARDLIITDDTHRRAKPELKESGERVNYVLKPFFQRKGKGKRAITQGFIGHSGKVPTTLGREGSDHTAAILAYLLDAEDLTIWKDVPGILNADPRYFNETRKLDRISYREAIELSYYGAKVLHPRTVQPLQRKGIPLYVKSFLDPLTEGTRIGPEQEGAPEIPCYILKKDQVLLSITPPDLSFVVETDLSHIFDLFSKKGVAINMMENSAIHFSVSIDRNEKLPALIKALEKDYEVLYNTGLELLTVRYYDEKGLEEELHGREVYLEQRSRHTARFVLKSKEQENDISNS